MATKRKNVSDLDNIRYYIPFCLHYTIHDLWLVVCRYGELQGLNKQETADRYGKEQVHEWRRSFDIPPPNGESLEMCAERAVAYFKEYVRDCFFITSGHAF